MATKTTLETVPTGTVARRSQSHLVALIACTLLVVACDGSVRTPLGPSDTGASAAMMPSDAPITTQGAGISVAMNQVGGSGYSGTCTVGDTRDGFRLKAEGQGAPNAPIMLVLQPIPATTFRYTAFTQTNQRGGFRTHWDGITFIPSGMSAECAVLTMDGTTTLARSATFTTP